MLRNIREYQDSGIRLLLTLKIFLIQLPFILWRYIYRFIIWYTVDFDMGYALYNAWHLYLLYLTINIINAYTTFFQTCYTIFFGTMNCFMFVFDWLLWIVAYFWIPLFIVFLIFLRDVHNHFKAKREMQELMWSFVHDEEDDPINIYSIRPQPGGTYGWGDRDVDYEPMPDFCAPTKYMKVSGMLGYVPGLTISEIIQRVHEALKKKLVPVDSNSEVPYEKFTSCAGTAMVYGKFKNIEDATYVFKTLDGYTYDVAKCSNSTENSSYSCRSNTSFCVIR